MLCCWKGAFSCVECEGACFYCVGVRSGGCVRSLSHLLSVWMHGLAWLTWNNFYIGFRGSSLSQLSLRASTHPETWLLFTSFLPRLGGRHGLGCLDRWMWSNRRPQRFGRATLALQCHLYWLIVPCVTVPVWLGFLSFRKLNSKKSNKFLR